MSNMDLFCFTLEGSTESIYEAVKSHNLSDVLPKYQGSCEYLRCKAERSGSDPSIHSDKHQTVTRSERGNSRSYKATMMLANKTLAGNESGVLTGQVQVKEAVPERNRADLTEHYDILPDSDESIQTAGRLKKLQKLVHIKHRHQSDGDQNDECAAKKHDCLVEGIRHNSKVLTCISLSGRTETSSSKAAAASNPLQPQENGRNYHEGSKQGGFWSPKMGHHRWKSFEGLEDWPSCQHTYHQTPPELCVRDGNSSFLSWNSDLDGFESLMQELDRKQLDLSLTQNVCFPTALKPLQIPKEETEVKLQGREMETSPDSDSKNISVSPEETQAAHSSNEAVKREAGHTGTRTKGHRQSRNSMESLYSLKSGQSSSSGVTSGSNCSSNRESLRLEDDLTFTGQFCCRARVHTEFVPSPYDTESLKLKVGDVIDVISKPPIGIWTGLLNGRIGNFKFIYVDVLTHSAGPNPPKVGQRSTVQEVLRCLHLEEYSSPLQLSGCQTVHDLMQLNVTDPAERERLLAAVNSLRKLQTDSLLENEACPEPETSSEDKKEDMNNPRDSGCLMTSESQDNCTEDGETSFLSEYAAPSDIKVP